MNKVIKPDCRSCKASSINQTVRAEVVYGGTNKHKFWQCSNCDLVYLWPVPSIDAEKEFYAEEFEKYMEKRSGEDRDWSGPEKHVKSNQDNVTRRLDQINKYINKGENVLEIGCSSGFMLDVFRDAGMKPVGIEPSGHFSEFLTSRAHLHYPSIEELLKNNSKIKFDLIVHFFVLEHIRNTKYFLEMQLDLLNDNGVIIAEVPCVYDPLTSLYDITAFEKFYWSIAHHYYFSPKSISFILDKIKCKYKLIPEQRYDLSNHFVWMQYGKPGGQNKYSNVFSNKTIESYKKDLKISWLCDTFFLYIWKE
jgi:SAM-dependent methyltransferase